MIDLRGILTNWFKNQLCPSISLPSLWAQYGLQSWLSWTDDLKQFKQAFGRRDKKQTMINLRGISTNCGLCGGTFSLK